MGREDLLLTPRTEQGPRAQAPLSPLSGMQYMKTEAN